jgi:hypothetical protein
LSSSDTIDFIVVLGNVLDIGTPSDSTVTNAKTNFASSSSSAGLQIKGDGTSSGTSGTLQLNCSLNTHGIKLASPAHTHGQNYTLTFPTTAPSADKFLKTDGSGNLSFADAGGSNSPYFYGKKASNQTTTRNTTTKITGFTTDELDSDSAFDGTTFTVPSGKGGRYYFGMNIVVYFGGGTGSDGERSLVYLYKNGGSVGFSEYFLGSSYNMHNVVNHFSLILDLNASDYIEVYAYNRDGNADGHASVTSSSSFFGYRLV